MRRLGSKNTAAALQTMTVRVPVSIRKRGVRKRVLMPDGKPVALNLQDTAPDSTAIKALARAFRWRKLLENGTYATIEDVAKAEKINPSYISRVLRLALLAPHIVEKVLTEEDSLRRLHLLNPFPVVWTEQSSHFRL